MKKMIVVLMVLVCGCASANWEDGTGKKISYKVLGARQLNKLEVDMEKGIITLGSSKGDAGEALRNATGAALNLSEVAKRAALVP